MNKRQKMKKRMNEISDLSEEDIKNLKKEHKEQKERFRKKYPNFDKGIEEERQRIRSERKNDKPYFIIP